MATGLYPMVSSTTGIRTIQDGSRHPLIDLACDTFKGLDVPHETNQNDEWKHNYAALSLCKEIAGVNLNPHGQNHSQKGIHLGFLASST